MTFMAFGNGVSDVLTSVASVLSSPQPKADLALGELIGMQSYSHTVQNLCDKSRFIHTIDIFSCTLAFLIAGGTIFITLNVTAAIVITRPFKVYLSIVHLFLC